MNRQQRAFEMLLDYPTFDQLLKPHYDSIKRLVRWENINYEALSGGEKSFVSWAYVVWHDKACIHYRDPFMGFSNLDKELQDLIFHAFAYRHGWVNALVEENENPK